MRHRGRGSTKANCRTCHADLPQTTQRSQKTLGGFSPPRPPAEIERHTQTPLIRNEVSRSDAEKDRRTTSNVPPWRSGGTEDAAARRQTATRVMPIAPKPRNTASTKMNQCQSLGKSSATAQGLRGNETRQHKSNMLHVSCRPTPPQTPLIAQAPATLCWEIPRNAT